MKARAAAAVLAALFLCAGLWGSAYAALPPGPASVVDGVESRILDLLSRSGSAEGANSGAFVAVSGLEALLEDLKDPQGPYADTPLGRMAAEVARLSAEPQDLKIQEALSQAWDQLTFMVLYELLQDEALDPQTQETILALIDLLPGTIETYMEPEGGGSGPGHGQGGGPDQRDRRLRETRFLSNESPAPAAAPAPAPGPAPAPQAFQPPQEHLDYTPDPPGDPVETVDLEDESGNPDPFYGFVDEPADPGFTFPFYGKEYDTFYVSTKGNITLTGGDTAWWPADPADYPPGPGDEPNRYLQTFPRVAPLWTDLTEAVQGQIKIDAEDTYYRVSWDGVGYMFPVAGSASLSATLYENGWIAFSYGDIDLAGSSFLGFINYGENGYHALVGLSPGDGTDPDHPGAGEARVWTEVDLSGTGGSYDYVNYEGIYEWWESLDGSTDGHAFDLADSYLIFKPGSPKYAATAGTRDMFVDIASLDRAMASTVSNDTLLAEVNAGAYAPGAFTPEGETNGFAGAWSGYPYGLQTVGRDSEGDPKVYTDAATLEHINQSGFMAYAVQVEEDRVNREILAMHRERLKGDLREQVDRALEYGDIRSRDDWLTQKADAQAGRVLKDRSGNWVRVQQYVLRPDEQTVQVLNVCLREGGELEGLSTIDWQTRFTESVNGRDLKTLPWSSWLDTKESGNERYVLTTASAPELEAMSVAFQNPADESLKEARGFAARSVQNDAVRQVIDQERLTLTAEGLSGTFDYAGGDAPLLDGQYRVVAHGTGTAPNPGGFHYAFRTEGPERSLNVAFFVLGDGDRSDNRGLASGDYSDVAFKDIWDALRVNEPGAPSIGENNLEIALDAEKQVFSRPVDVVYIPMSRMLWK